MQVYTSEKFAVDEVVDVFYVGLIPKTTGEAGPFSMLELRPAH